MPDFLFARVVLVTRIGGSGDENGDPRGLAILAAGRDDPRRVNFEDFAHQKTLLDTDLMTVGKWLSSHPGQIAAGNGHQHVPNA
jgi:hypothetical protein